MAGRTLPGPQFPDDDGSASAEVQQALAGYAEGLVSDLAVLSVLAGSRLLMPIVAVPAEQETTCGGHRHERESDLAMPTLVGDDGRRAVLGFTSSETLARWRPDARPSSVHARSACERAVEQGADAVVVDVAGPVPYVIEGARLRIIASGGSITGPHDDPDVLAAVLAVTKQVAGVDGVKVGPGARAELAVRVRLAEGADEQATLRAVAGGLSERLRGRVTGGVELGLVPASR